MNYGQEKKPKKRRRKKQKIAFHNVSSFHAQFAITVAIESYELVKVATNGLPIAYYRISTQIKMVISLLEHKIYIEINLLMKCFINTLMIN